ncbi:discoidin domain-containing receptor 2-like [Anthonomus grandis grandis]|uniref:discoidin domain-containing receptor 2-like n=1 Tax=Anthonomus grandis grandis TaxID=2921223 RepID=UPI0021657559|nr:discoidin domain-containing receptor 2-like [Anthonomus grandis grandis]XP_050301158.1 discoidin domain-containing receptor 2-like [Anthonomus grandis grandis]
MRKLLGKTGIFSLVLSLLYRGVSSVDISQCIGPLGMENGLIKDHDVTASSSFDPLNVGPQHGRIRTELNGGAWCPQSPATQDTKEWIEIDLHSVHLITGTETQGRFGNGLGVEYAEEYVIEYFRPRLNKWTRYRSKTNNHLLKGNQNTYLESKTSLDPPIWASKIRFLPYSSHRRTVCMRVEVYGCKWTDEILSYSMPQGDKKGNNWEFYDFSYDGDWDGYLLKSGLGQLVDGLTAPDDFRESFQFKNLQGWVGWRSDLREDNFIDITFEFGKLREFRGLYIFCNNQFLRDVQVFSALEVFFSIDGTKYKGAPIRYDHVSDSIFEDAKNISVGLLHRVGKFVKLRLHFAAKWILVSEVRFDTMDVRTDFVEADSDSVLPTTKSNLVEFEIKESSDYGMYLGIVVSALVLLLLVMGFVVVFVFLHQRRLRKFDVPRGVQSGNKGLNFYEGPPLDIITIPPDYDLPAEDFEYSVPLQEGYASPSDTLGRNATAYSDSEQYYTSVDMCNKKTYFSPPPSVLDSPNLTKPLNYDMNYTKRLN